MDSPFSRPETTATKSPRAVPRRTNCWRSTFSVWPVFSFFFSSITKTESPYGA